MVSLALCQALTPPCQVQGSLCTLLPFQACCIVQAESSTTHITTSFPDYSQSPHLPIPYQCCIKPRPCRHVKSLRLMRQMNQIPCAPVPQLSVYILTCRNDWFSNSVSFRPNGHQGMQCCHCCLQAMIRLDKALPTLTDLNPHAAQQLVIWRFRSEFVWKNCKRECIWSALARTGLYYSRARWNWRGTVTNPRVEIMLKHHLMSTLNHQHMNIYLCIGLRVLHSPLTNFTVLVLRVRITLECCVYLVFVLHCL